METFLKKRSRVHKYRELLTRAEIDEIVARHVSKLKSIQVFNFGPKTNWPEVFDEYQEAEARIVANLRSDLQQKFRTKIKLPIGSDSHMALNQYLQNI